MKGKTQVLTELKGYLQKSSKSASCVYDADEIADSPSKRSAPTDEEMATDSLTVPIQDAADMEVEGEEEGTADEDEGVADEDEGVAEGDDVHSEDEGAADEDEGVAEEEDVPDEDEGAADEDEGVADEDDGPNLLEADDEAPDGDKSSETKVIWQWDVLTENCYTQRRSATLAA